MHINDEIITARSTGEDLFRRTIRPKSGELRGVFLMLHGLGDHQGCHIECAELLAKQGFASVGIDWPGSGSSHGIRGDIPGIQIASELIDEQLEFIAEKFSCLPVGIYSHSTGGFFVLRHIALQERNPVDWLWFSSPLLNPRHGVSPLLLKFAPVAAKRFPKLTVTTGVTLEKIRHIDPNNPRPGHHRIEGRHNRVSLRLGADLLLHGPDVHAAGPILTDPVKVLITQGSGDEICPPQYSKKFFDCIASSEKEYALLHGLRHEMFREPANDEFIEVASDWLSNL